MEPLHAGHLTDYRFPFDVAVYHLLNDAPFPLPELFRGVSRLWFGALCLCLAFGAIGWRYRRRAFWPALTAAVALGATDLIGARALKPLFHRLRPCYALPSGTFHVWLPAANHGSLPSLHAANAFAVAWVLSRTVPRWRFAAYAAATLLAVSRVVVGVHWPTDVLFGALFGTVVGVLAQRVVRRVERRLRPAAQGA